MRRFDKGPCYMEENDEGKYVLHSDHAAEMKRIEDDYLKLNNIACELRARAERAEKYVSGQDVRSDFRTAGEMRAALELARAELARVEGERDSIRNAVVEACMLSGCNSAKELREALERNYKRATNAEKANALLRAECEAWRRGVSGDGPIFERFFYSDSWSCDDGYAIRAARDATDAAGILRGGES